MYTLRMVSSFFDKDFQVFVMKIRIEVEDQP